MKKFLLEWGWFIVLVFFGEIAYSDGSFAFSVKKDIKPEIPIVVIETFPGLGALAVVERIEEKHKFVIMGRIGEKWVFFDSSPKN